MFHMMIVAPADFAGFNVIEVTASTITTHNSVPMHFNDAVIMAREYAATRGVRYAVATDSDVSR